MPERVVFDTNVWISGLLWRGKPYQCLLLARSQVVQHAHCSEMIAELARKLREPFGFSENHIRAVLYDLRRVSDRSRYWPMSKLLLTIPRRTEDFNGAQDS